MRRSFVLILSISAIAAGPGCEERKIPAPQPMAVRVAPAECLDPQKLQSGPAYIAAVRGDNETDLSFKVGGILEFVGPRPGEDWKEGTTVLEGAVLARLIQTDFVSAREAASAKAELDRKSLERATRLLGERAISIQDSDISKANLQASEAALAQAEQSLKDSVIRAPYAGTILARNATAGETIAPGRPVLRFADLRQMSVELGVPDSVVNRIRVGQDVRFGISALEGVPFTGKVSEVGVAAKEGTRLFKVVLKISNPDGRIKSGMTASVPFSEARPVPTGAVLVPLSALVTDNAGQLAVFLVGADHHVRLQRGKTDDIVGSSVLVTEGIAKNDPVVVAGAGLLHDGALVQVR
jgi:RND family efflux transporter MFP subunit